MTYMTEGLVLTDTQGTVAFINHRLSKMLGYPPEQILGKIWLDM
ncbi:PAS domain-containing protein [Desulfotignum phosphitoxidans]|uniref:PAS domain-containing protein n=1 Tax=Desulfotignum phosphitoxidans DSM 13687 TaxID=1286635 RepID=S0G7V2_9BACT|nr:PAS domain-containing protein [Desulfotignum phosphitoxidans]EMS81186.1 PAS domain-containing protein [Desulfotignum phosphitoxidans DSM 13687]